MNITLSGTKVSMDGHTLAFQKNNLVDSMVITVDTDETWQYKLDVKYPCKDSNGKELYNVIDLTRVGNTCTAILQATMLPFNGKYTMQLRGISDDKVYHTDTFDVWVKYSIDPSKVYDPVPSEFYQIEANITSMNNHPPKPGNNGYWLVWNVAKQEYEESDIPLPEDTLPEVSDSTNGWYLTNDGERVYWADVQGGSGEGDITAIQVNGINQPIVDKVAKLTIDKDTVGLGNLDNVRQYSSVNPPPYPVASVNGETGAVTLFKADVGLGNVDNVKQYSASNPPPYPVTSVNGKTGDVQLDIPKDDNPLGITGATVGQIAKITAVDTDGKPTAWEAVDITEEKKAWAKIIDVEITEATMLFEATGLDNVTELYCEWGGLKTASETNKRDLDLYINDISVGGGWVLNAGSNGQDMYGYSISTYNGLVWYNTRSSGIAGASNAHNPSIGNNAKISYGLVHGVGAARNVKIKAVNANNAPVVGKLEVWAR